MYCVDNQPDSQIIGPVTEVGELIIESPDFRGNGTIPKRFTCEGENINPSIVIRNVPEGTGSLVVIMTEVDSVEEKQVHWLMYNVPVTSFINENSSQGDGGLNDFKNCCYNGPCPNYGSRDYCFRVYAVDRQIELMEGGLTREELESIIQDHILACGKIVGMYRKFVAWENWNSAHSSDKLAYLR